MEKDKLVKDKFTLVDKLLDIRNRVPKIRPETDGTIQAEGIERVYMGCQIDIV